MFVLQPIELKQMNTPLSVPLSLYIHIPWCVQKCPYCDFNSHQIRSEIPEKDYICALIADLEQDLSLVWGRRVSSIFIGGGTPSLLSAEGLEELMSAVRARLPLYPDAEITLEANPGSVEQAKFKAFYELGINRLSIGVQSFDDAQLKSLGRIHDANEARAAIKTAQKAGFENINIDLMFALPEQTLEQAAADVQAAVDFGVNHISYYQLTLEPNTAFYHKPPRLPEDDLAWQMQQQGHSLLLDKGYSQYEVSAFSLPGKQSRHNLNYWRFGDYLAIGAGAHAKITDLAQGTIVRFSKPRHPQQYMRQAGDASCLPQHRSVAKADRVLEFVMNALRLNDGFPISLFEQTTGLSILDMDDKLSRAEQRGFIQRKSGNIHTTEHGSRFLNDLLQIFMEE